MHLAIRPAGAATTALLLSLALAAPALAQSESEAPQGSATPQEPATVSAGSLDGTWTVDPSIGSFDYAAGDFSGTWVGYRVQEELVRVGGAVAVGRTPDLTGSITVEGSAVTAADLTADLTTLRSDERFRDGQLGRQGIQTDQFPTATFTLTEPIELGELPAEDESISAEATGDLTIHGVTQNVTIPLAAAWRGDIIGVGGSYTFVWEDFDMDRPEAMTVVSLADELTMELQAFFRRDA